MRNVTIGSVRGVLVDQEVKLACTSCDKRELVHRAVMVEGREIRGWDECNACGRLFEKPTPSAPS